MVDNVQYIIDVFDINTLYIYEIILFGHFFFKQIQCLRKFDINWPCGRVYLDIGGYINIITRQIHLDLWSQFYVIQNYRIFTMSINYFEHTVAMSKVLNLVTEAYDIIVVQM